MDHGALWVFGYGSLIWDPDFPAAERVVARLEGWHRSFCMWSIHYRGTQTDPGLVLALDEGAGAACQGVAFRVAPGAEAATLEGLRRRELISSAYREAVLPVELADGRRVQAVAYVIERGHAQYCGGLSPSEQAAIIARAAGDRGPNRDYLFATVEHLGALGIGDPDLEALAEDVKTRCG